MNIRKPNLQLPNLKLSGNPLLERIQQMPRKQRMQVIFSVIALPLALLFFISGAMENDEAPSVSPQVQEQQQEEDATQSELEKGKRVSSLDTLGADTLLMQNPFVEESQFTQLASNPALPAVPTTRGATPQVSVPVMPHTSESTYTPRPSVPLPSIPSIGAPPAVGASAPDTPSVATPGTSASVAGVLTGEDGGNMAIMSDGKVVSEGDNYNGNRIAYIGGDGIKFDDGHSIDYK